MSESNLPVSVCGRCGGVISRDVEETDLGRITRFVCWKCGPSCVTPEPERPAGKQTAKRMVRKDSPEPETGGES